MAQEMCILPVRCKRCNAVFDLWYDLDEQNRQEITLGASGPELSKLFSQSLCWNCRKHFLSQIEEQENNSDSEEEIVDITLEFE